MPPKLNKILIWLSTLFIATNTLNLVANSQTNTNEIYRILSQPTIVDSQSGYSVNDIVNDYGLRHLAPSVDFQSIKFPTGSAVIPFSERWKVEPLADVIHQFVRANPKERFLIEGHTDTVGRFEDNLHLSLARADAVTSILTHDYLVPTFAVTPVGFGYTDLAANTSGPDPRNRRVTLRRVTDLMFPENQNNTNTLQQENPSQTPQQESLLQSPSTFLGPRIKPDNLDQFQRDNKSLLDL